MALIHSRSLADFRDLQLTKWKSLVPSIATSQDSLVYLDAAVVAEIAYMLQQDAITLTNNAFLAYATGDELTNLGLDRGIPRKAAIKAVWEVTFSKASVSGTTFPIPTGTIISTAPSEVDGVYVAFQTTEDWAIYGQLQWPNSPTINRTDNPSGRFTPATYRFAIAAKDQFWETLVGTESSLVVTTQSSISLTWTAVPWATGYAIYFASGSSPLTKARDSDSASFSFPDTGTLPWTSPQSTNTTGSTSATVSIEATVAGIGWNVWEWVIINFIQKPTGVDSVVNSMETSWGTDEETDEDYLVRIKDVLENNSSKVTVSGYENTCKKVNGVVNAKVVFTQGQQYRNEFQIIITSSDANGIPSPALLAEVSEFVNSDANRAVCDAITVVAPTTQAINITVSVSAKDPSFTEAYLRQEIINNLTAYLPTITVGTKVYVVELANVVHDTVWVIDFSVTTPNANVTLAAWAIAISGTITVNFV